MAEKSDTNKRRLPIASQLVSQIGPLASIWRYRVMFVVILMTVVLVALAAALLLPARYLATGLVIVAEADPAMQTSDVWAQKQGDPADLESQIMILRSTRLVKLALAQPGAMDAVQEICRELSGGCEGVTADTPALVERVASRYAVTAVGRSRVLSVSYTSSSPDDAMTMANALVTAYLAEQKGAESSSRAVAAKWLWQEVDDLDKEIRAQVAKIDEFRGKNGLVQGARASISSESLTTVSEQLAGAQQAKAQAQAKLDAIRDIKNGREAADVDAVLDSRTVADIKQQMAQVGNQLAATKAVLGERHPQRQMLEASLATLQQQLNREISRIATSAQKNLEAANNLVASLQKQLQVAKGNASEALVSESSLEGMVRDVDAKRQLYTQLYQRASELETERRSLSGGGRLVSLAEKPSKPNFPKKTPMLAAGFALGLFFAGASCVLRDRVRYRLAELALDEDDVEQRDAEGADDADKAFEGDKDAVDAPVAETVRPIVAPRSPEPRPYQPLSILGSLPDFPAIGLVAGEDDNLGSALRRCLLSVRFRQNVKVLASELIDSFAGQPILALSNDPSSRSGVFLTLLLGEELAKRGLSVLAIECAPAMLEFVDALDLSTPKATLADVISGDVPIGDAVLHTRHEGFDVIPGDVKTGAVIKAGATDGLKLLLDLGQAYDLVLISGPALLDPQAQGVFRALAETDVNALVCVDREGDYDEAVSVAAVKLANLDLNSIGAVLMPSAAGNRRVTRLSDQRSIS